MQQLYREKRDDSDELFDEIYDSASDNRDNKER